MALLLVSGATWAESADAIVRSESIDLVEEFEKLAKWCTGKKLLKSRNQVYESILHFRPDHAAARRWLRYKKNKKGAWVRDKYRVPKDFAPEFLPAFEKRRTAITAQFCARLLKLLDSADEDPSPRVVQVVLSAVIAADPNNAEARERNREVRSGGRWLLRETIEGRERRAMLRAEARKIRRSIPAPRMSAVSALGGRFRMKRGCRGQRWRGDATVPASELSKLVQVSDAVGPLVEAVFDVDVSRHDGAFFVGKTREEFLYMVRVCPDYTAEDRKFATRAGGVWIPKRLGFMSYGFTAESRLDSTVRMVASAALRRNVTEVAEQGWLVEGVGLYVNYLLIGTRHTIFVERSAYARSRGDPSKKLDLWERIQMPKADWVGLALELHDKGKKADYPFLLTKKLNQMVVEDLLHSYALAAYVIEGRADKMLPFLRSFGQKRRPTEIVADVMETTLPGLEKRVVRWMRERTRK